VQEVTVRLIAEMLACDGKQLRIRAGSVVDADGFHLLYGFWLLLPEVLDQEMPKIAFAVAMAEQQDALGFADR
jgi:hypothetical protein